jgi:hypothetical protein
MATKMVMTVVDMMNEIATKVQALDNAKPGEEREMAVEDAQIITGLAKNFFIGANIAVEKERLQARYKVLHSSLLDDIVGGCD